ncbi:ArdC-like ssDNA-binding domain-containing protein [Enterovibrio paralichthyis]|uniref:ArdC-like ssDNA-binding domain-containing protein n=1 Tax=Enterovibrio paralichthyis TaxID=2853805 RepID=UPI001C465CE4|nr:ArdC-like ssDNA-binding domain-containing protein [Enterovibrio paralichthyis]MBV7300291.1 ArdC family protein [Enterovibrio paralichthyis]
MTHIDARTAFMFTLANQERLEREAIRQGFSDPRWASALDWRRCSRQIKPDSKGCLVCDELFNHGGPVSLRNGHIVFNFEQTIPLY